MKKFAVLIALTMSFMPRQVLAEKVFGVTVFKDLVTFDSAAPGTILTTTPITGLVGQSSFESVVGIDFRPVNKQLYALGNAPGNIYRIYTVNAASGVATQVGADISIFTGSFQGFDFNPVADLLRIVTETDQNHRFNPTTGALVSTDPALAFLGTDANAAANPNIVGAAYTKNVGGVTTLYDIDSTLDILTTQSPANNGTLNTVGALGVNFSNFVGFDISESSGVAYASVANNDTFTSQLYTVNLTTGAATLSGAIGSELLINDIAVQQTVPEASGLTLLSVGALTLAGRVRRRQGDEARASK